MEVCGRLRGRVSPEICVVKGKKFHSGVGSGKSAFSLCRSIGETLTRPLGSPVIDKISRSEIDKKPPNDRYDWEIIKLMLKEERRREQKKNRKKKKKTTRDTRFFG